MKISLRLAGLLACLSAAPLFAAPLLLQNPGISQKEIVFSYGDDLWIVPREGGHAHRLATGKGRLDLPRFSPDGTLVAYSSNEDGNDDIFVVPASGGEPRRLTSHPANDRVLGWTPDGRRVLFASGRSSDRDLPQLYTVDLEGGLPEKLPLPSGNQASYSPDGSHLAYVPFMQWQPAWKKYRGGQTTPVWLADLSDSSVTKVPRTNSNDGFPMWTPKGLFLVSDRDGRRSLYNVDTTRGQVRRVVENTGLDIQSASASSDAIVYDQFGELHVYELASGKDHVVPVTISDDLPRTHARFEKVQDDQILNAAVSPSGKRVLVETHGEILSVPAEKGDARNLTQSPGVADRDPAWSPDGKTVACFSDASGEYALHLIPQDGLGTPKVIPIPQGAGYYYGPRWSADSTHLLFSDKQPALWCLTVATGELVKVDTNSRDEVSFDADWSPDGKWIVYTKRLPSGYRAVILYNLETKATHQVTDGYSDACGGRFDQGGKYLYFAASTNVALAGSPMDMSGFSRPVTSAVYAAVLSSEEASPVAPQSDEEEGEKPADKAKEEKTKEPAKADSTAVAATPDKGEKDKAAKDDKAVTPVRIDFESLEHRIVALPLPAANYVTLEAGKANSFYLLSLPDVLGEREDNMPPGTLTRFDLTERKATTIATGVERFALSANHEKLLYGREHKLFLVPADKEAKPGDGEIKTENLVVYVDPRQEWRQIYNEAWRIQRDFFYDPKYHGLDLKAAQAFYEPYLAGIACREDLTVLFEEMTGWLSVGHTFIRGGGPRPSDPVPVGLLGADYRIDSGHYQIARILPGENWNPKLASPLTRPGVKVHEGDYLLAVNGQELKGSDDISALFRHTAGKQTVLRVASKADGSDAHNETVVPIPNEAQLRYKSWVDTNRRRVDELSGGKLAYVHVPDTGMGGYTSFNRYYYAQVGRQGAIIDERFNHGGSIADYIVDQLTKTPAQHIAYRYGPTDVTPSQAIYGPKVMLINEMSGSGGDYLPWLFRRQKAGTLVGMRTWGGLVGIGGYPELIDGGGITAPRMALYNLEGRMDVENAGVPPDVEVEQDPKLVRQGRDPQLEKAVSIALEQLKNNPPPVYPAIQYPDFKPTLPARK
jgi:tricorn protease